MISTNPSEDRALKMVAGTMLAMMAALASLRACHALRSLDPVCAAVEAFRMRAAAYFMERRTR